MYQVGVILKAKREALKLTIEEVSKQTRYSVAQIEAIENEDIAFFKDDYAYYKLYLRGYCNFLNLDYNEIREEVEKTLFDITGVKNVNDIEKNDTLGKEKLIPKRARRKIKLGKIANKREFSSKFSTLFTLIIIITLLALSMIFIDKIISDSSSNSNNDHIINDNPPINDNNNDDNIIDEPTDENKEISIIQTKSEKNHVYYEVKNLTAYQVKIVFKNRCWLGLNLSGKASEFNNKTYQNGDVIEFEITKDELLASNFGYINGNEIYINDVLLELPQELSSHKGALKITIDFKIGE